MHRDSLDAVRATTSARYHWLSDASCYEAGEPSRLGGFGQLSQKDPVRGLSAANQFGPDQVTLIHRRELCVLALKNPPPITTTTITTSTTTTLGLPSDLTSPSNGDPECVAVGFALC